MVDPQSLVCSECDARIPCQHDVDTMRGIRLPPDFSDRRLRCVVYGIRHHEAFVRSREVEELCATSDHKVLARARNARLIMSNEIPDMASDDVKPYCIWYPEVASEETYRKLAKAYPDMVYAVGRACAVAGYDNLYHELNILPEVSIAEEARDNASAEDSTSAGTGSKAIFDYILSQPVCYAVLDDYTRTTNLDNPRCPAFMNGDTAVRSLLDVRVGVDKFRDWYLQREQRNFDIVEDDYIAETSSEMTHRGFQALAREHEDLMYTPLPLHLPTITKDLLILMAAYEGNLDRYVRLRRPKMVDHEEEAVIRGIYHNTTFAKYWSLQKSPRDEMPTYSREIKRATIARFIMVNDLSHITPTVPAPEDMPGMIWWPLLPAEETLRELVRRRPDMRLQAAMTCIEANYEQLWDELEPEPIWPLTKMAQRQFITTAQQPWRSHYTDYLERREAEEKKRKEAGEEEWEDLATAVREARRPSYYGRRTIGQGLCEDAAIVDKEPTTTLLPPGIGPLWEEQQDSVYAVGRQADMSEWELYICSSEEMRQRAWKEGSFEVFHEDDYPWSLYPRHYQAKAARDFEERARRAQKLQEYEHVDGDAV